MKKRWNGSRDAEQEPGGIKGPLSKNSRKKKCSGGHADEKKLRIMQHIGSGPIARSFFLHSSFLRGGCYDDWDFSFLFFDFAAVSDRVVFAKYLEICVFFFLVLRILGGKKCDFIFILRYRDAGGVR